MNRSRIVYEIVLMIEVMIFCPYLGNANSGCGSETQNARYVQRRTGTGLRRSGKVIVTGVPYVM